MNEIDTIGLINDTEVLQPAVFNAGLRIGRIQEVKTIFKDGSSKIDKHNFWYDTSGKLQKITTQ